MMYTGSMKRVTCNIIIKEITGEGIFYEVKCYEDKWEKRKI